jgi:hypothetical protein
MLSCLRSPIGPESVGRVLFVDLGAIVLVPIDGVFGRFDLAALRNCHT